MDSVKIRGDRTSLTGGSLAETPPQSSWNLDHGFNLVGFWKGRKARERGKVVRREDLPHWGRYGLLN